MLLVTIHNDFAASPLSSWIPYLCVHGNRTIPISTIHSITEIEVNLSVRTRVIINSDDNTIRIIDDDTD